MSLHLAHNFAFADLYARDGLTRLDAAFCADLQGADVGLFNQLMTARQDGFASKLTESEFLIALAPYVESFIGDLFGVKSEIASLRATHNTLSPIYECKRQFVQRRAAKKYNAETAASLDGDTLRGQLEKILGSTFTTALFAEKILLWLADEKNNEQNLILAEQYTGWALHTDAGRAYHKKDTLFKLPKKIDPQNLVPVETEMRDGYKVLKLPQHELRARDGFKLTDAGGGLEYALDQANYCIWCHKQGKDSCSTGLREKSSNDFQKSPHGVTLAGCPLEEKISEMNLLKSHGNIIGSLGVVTIDNPLCALTGHRICNDCMKSCIYQKQEPVDIPQVETQVLKDVLQLPWGFEIYSLLTRWNPLNVRRPLPAPETNRKILVVGAGPAGINLSHHLLNDGHYVCLIDGLKIEPLAVPFEPIKNIESLREELDERAMAGFGGVAEYGITVRWDKNFLKIVRLILQRRAMFDLFGGVRFGGTIGPGQAFEAGFDHIALCLGAGKPTLLDIPGNLAKGVRAASDFLMALQLTGAGKEDSLANLQIRLPAVVIGGGLTAIDTATEILAYYPLQVKKFAERYQALDKKPAWSGAEKIVAEEFLAHAKLFHMEQSKANPDMIGLLQSLGGARICYRKNLQAAPSYTLNHEEVHKALEEGIFISEDLTPIEIQTDEDGAVSAVKFKDKNGEVVTIPARSVLVAAGTLPNTVLAREDDAFALDGKYFAACNHDGARVAPQRSVKPDHADIFVENSYGPTRISFFGDLHPSFSGNVVKAMASALRGYPLITESLQKIPASSRDVKSLREFLRGGLTATIHAVNRLTPTIIEVVLHAPLAAQNFKPGQFYRLQNFEATNGTAQASEGMAMTGAWVDVEKGLLATIILEMGGSSSLCANWRAGDPVVLMGPTGTPSEIPQNEKVILVGGGLGNAVLFSIGKAMRAANNRVIYFAGYKNSADRFKPEEIESAADAVVWAHDIGDAIQPARAQDRTFKGSIVQAMTHHYDLLKDANRILCIGSDRMMAAVASARHNELKKYLPDAHIAIGSINSPMQCMMKEICAQCIQRHIDPKTGREEIVFSCFNQDQDLDRVDWKCLNERLSQNGAQEKLTASWIKRL